MKKALIFIALCLSLSCSALAGCGGDDYDADDLGNAIERDLSGEKLNSFDRGMVDGFKEWKSKQ